MNKYGTQRLFSLNSWGKIKSAFYHMMFPEVCLSCSGELTQTEEALCANCHYSLPYTYFESYNEPSSMDQLFWGRVQIQNTYSLLYFEKGKSTQKILHDLKYNSNANVGVLFGRLIGKKLLPLEKYSDIDLLIPVPIHPKKEFIRGYNQSLEIAKGISEVFEIPIDLKSLSKKETTGSQTKRNRFDRWDNVVDNFKLTKSMNSAQHIAIVDDVITTGSTLEALVRSIHNDHPNLKISIICLALAK